ncbi:MAG TPA: chemotaxis protein CheW [Deltaproteobacteria bacterium]|nr:chemotaxis protein CheW [Deltaproteobacteria bacterium]
MGEFDDLIEEFVTESKEHIADIEEDLIRIETDKENVDPEVINRVFRAAHSIKGSAKFLDLTNIGELAHKMEDVLNLIRAGKLVPTSDVASTLLHGADMLKSMFEDVIASNAMDISEQIEALQAVLKGGAPAVQTQKAEGAPASKPRAGKPGMLDENLLRQKLGTGQLYLITAARPGLEQDLSALGEVLGNAKDGRGRQAVVFASIMEMDVLPMALQIDADDICEVRADMIPGLIGKPGPTKPQAAPAPRPETRPERITAQEPEGMDEEIMAEVTNVEPQKTMEAADEAELHRDNTSYITFSLDNETYAVPIYMVEEIIGLQDISLLPNVPDFIKGVINLRGDIVPIMDLRLKFRLEMKEYNPQTVFLIVRVKERVMGMVVDKVSDVLVIDPSRIQQTPAFFAKISTEFIDGVYKDPQGQLVIIINIGALIRPEEWSTDGQESRFRASA